MITIKLHISTDIVTKNCKYTIRKASVGYLNMYVWLIAYFAKTKAPLASSIMLKCKTVAQTNRAKLIAIFLSTYAIICL